MSIVLLIAIILAFIFGVLWLIASNPILNFIFTVLIVCAIIIGLICILRRLLRFLWQNRD